MMLSILWLAPLLIGVDGAAFVAPSTPRLFAVRTRLSTDLASQVADAPAKSKPEKFTPEALELEQVLQEREKRNLKYIVAQTAPAVRVAFSEAFGQPPGAFEPGLMVSALKKLGFDLVLDTNTAADLCICEEGTELLNRVLAKQAASEGEATEDMEPLPLFTSCCPGWLNLVEKSAPELFPYISSCKSPHMMYGALVKEFSQELMGVDPKEIYTCSVMPCIRKRGESDQPCFVHDEYREVNNVITTVDLGMMLRKRGIDPAELEPIDFDSPFQKEPTGSGLGTGAGQLFGATGGVMEAAVRSVYELVTGAPLPRLELEEIRGMEGVRETTVPLYNEETGKGLKVDLKVAVVAGLGNAKKLISQIKDGEIKYDFVEVMACPGGCISGGGQPRADQERMKERLECIYSLDKSLPIRRSHENPVVKALYERHLGGEYGSEEAKKVLHVKPVYGGPEADEKSDELKP